MASAHGKCQFAVNISVERRRGGRLPWWGWGGYALVTEEIVETDVALICNMLSFRCPWCTYVCVRSVMSDCDPMDYSLLDSILSMGFSRQEYWNGLPFPPSGDLPNPGIKPVSLESPALAGRFFTTVLPGKLYLYRDVLWWIHTQQGLKLYVSTGGYNNNK